MSRSTSPLQKIKGESDKAWNAFCIYAQLGIRRSIDKAYEEFRRENPDTKPRRNNSTRSQNRHWFDWSKKYNWVQRVKAYDEWVFEETQKYKLENMRYFLAEISERILDNLEKDLEVSANLRGQLNQALQNRDLKPLTLKLFSEAHKNVVSTQKDIYQTYLELTGIAFVAERLQEEEKERVSLN